MENWIHVDSQSGTGNKTIQVTVDENQTASSRSTSLTFKTTGGTTSVATITQSAGVRTYGVPTIEISYPDAPAKGGVISPVWSITQTWGWNGSSTNGGTIEIDNTTPDKPESLIMEYIVGINKGVSFDTSTGVATVSSLGTTVKSRETMLSGHVEVTLNGVSSEELTGNFQLTQEANAIESSSYRAYVQKMDEFGTPTSTVNIEEGSSAANNMIQLSSWGKFYGDCFDNQWSSVRGNHLKIQFKKVDIYTSETEDVTNLKYQANSEYSDQYNLVSAPIRFKFDINLKVTDPRETIPVKFPTRVFGVTTDDNINLTIGFSQPSPYYFFVAGTPVPNVRYCTYSERINRTTKSANWDLVDVDFNDNQSYVGIVIGDSSTFNSATSEYYLLKDRSEIQLEEGISWMSKPYSLSDTNGMIPLSIQENASTSSRSGSFTLNYPDEEGSAYGGPFTINVTQPGTKEGKNRSMMGVTGGAALTMRINGDSTLFSQINPILAVVFEAADGREVPVYWWWNITNNDTQLDLSSFTGTAEQVIPSETLSIKELKLDFSDFHSKETGITINPEISIPIKSSPAGLDRTISVSSGDYTFDAGTIQTIPTPGTIGGDNSFVVSTFNNTITVSGGEIIINISK